MMYGTFYRAEITYESNRPSHKIRFQNFSAKKQYVDKLYFISADLNNTVVVTDADRVSRPQGTCLALLGLGLMCRCYSSMLIY